MGFNGYGNHYNFGNPWSFYPYANNFDFNFNTSTPFSNLPYGTQLPWQNKWLLDNNYPSSFNHPVNNLTRLNILPTDENLARYAQTALQINDICKKHYGPTWNDPNYYPNLQLQSWNAAVKEISYTGKLPAQIPGLPQYLQYQGLNLLHSQPLASQNHFDPTHWKNNFEQAHPNFKVPRLEDESTIIDLNPKPNQVLVGQQNFKRALENQGIDTSAMGFGKDCFLLKDLQESKKKFSALTQEVSPQPDESLSNPPVPANEDQMSSFERGKHDEDQIASFVKNQLAYPKGSPERFSPEYLKNNLLGHGEGVGAKLAYFSGSLSKKIENGLKKVKEGCQVMGHFLDPCSGESFDYMTNGAGGLVKNCNLPTQMKDSLEILALSDHQSLGMQAAIQSGASADEISQEALSYIYRSAATEQPELQLGLWDRHLLNRQKGLAHKVFKAGNDLASFAHSMSLYTGSSALDEMLDLEERIQLEGQFAEDVNSSALNRELAAQKMADASINQAKEIGSHIAHEVFDCFAEFQSQLIHDENSLQKLFSNFLPKNLSNDLNLLSYDQQQVFATDLHQKIDSFFSTNQATKYSPESKSNQDIALGIMPCPHTPYDIVGVLKIPPTLANKTIGWKIGQPINNLTQAGKCPRWSAVRQRHWKNKAHLHKNGVKFEELVYEPTPQNIKRMEKGLAPLIKRIDGGYESVELHHVPPQREGGLFNFIEVTKQTHIDIDPFRR